LSADMEKDNNLYLCNGLFYICPVGNESVITTE
jgi:hypothetical protein